MTKSFNWMAFILNLFGPLLAVPGLGFAVERRWRAFRLSATPALALAALVMTVGYAFGLAFDPVFAALFGIVILVYVATWVGTSFLTGRRTLYAGTTGDHAGLAWGIVAVGLLAFTLPPLSLYQIFVMERTFAGHPWAYGFGAFLVVLFATLPGVAAVYAHGGGQGWRPAIRYLVAFVLPLVGLAGTGAFVRGRPFRAGIVFLSGATLYATMVWCVNDFRRTFDFLPEVVGQLALHAYVILWSWDSIVAVGAEEYGRDGHFVTGDQVPHRTASGHETVSSSGLD